MQPVSKTINLYVAGCYYDDRIPTLIEELCAIPGVAVPYNWTRYIKQEEGVEKRMPADSAIFDITGVEQCDMLVVVMDMHDYAYRGTFTELGAALALEKPILMMIDKGDGANNNTEPQHASSNCFFHHPAILHVHHLDQIKRVINALAQPEPLKLMVLGAARHGG
jgi:nucleoside 2-deoxyribosyltransferase